MRNLRTVICPKWNSNDSHESSQTNKKIIKVLNEKTDANKNTKRFSSDPFHFYDHNFNQQCQKNHQKICSDNN